jgi:branched-chain amino acid transport system substrate-binding protein
MRDMFVRLLLSALAATTALAMAQVALAQVDPIRVGFLTVRTGPLAAGGKQMEEGILLFLKERNNTIAGRKVELIIADTGGNPAGARTKTQDLVERSKVHVIIGPLAAFEAIAIDDYIRQTKTPIVSCSAAAEDLTQRKTSPWFARSAASSAQPNHALGDYAAKTLGYKRVVIIADDFAYGHETAAGFQRVFEDAGGKVVQKLWSPLNVPDYGTYIAQIKTNVDAVYAGFAGANGFRFLKQYREYGMKLPVLGSMTTADEGILKQMGDEALGVVTGGWYAAGIESPENARFVAAVKQGVRRRPGLLHAWRLLGRRARRGGRQGGERQGRGQGSLHESDSQPGRRQGPARRMADGRVRQPRNGHLHPQGRTEGRQAREHRGQDLPAGEPVLDVRPEGVPRGARLFARLAAGEEPGAVTR